MKKAKSLHLLGMKALLGAMLVFLLWGTGFANGEIAEDEAFVLTVTEALSVADEHNLRLANARLDLEHAEKQFTKAQADAAITPSPVALRQAEIDLELHKLLLQETRRQVELEVQNTYYEVNSKIQLQDIAAANLVQVEEQLRIISVKHDEGLATKLDLLNAEKGVLQAKGALEAANAGVELSLLELKNALGVPYTEEIVLEESEALVDPLDLTMEQVVDRVLKHSIELTRLQWSLEVHQLQEESAKNEYTAPLIKELHSNRRMKAELELKEGTRSVFFSAKQAWNNLNQAESDVAVAEKELEAAEENYKIIKTRFEGGLEIPNNLLQAQVSLTSAQHAVVSARFNFHLARIRLLNLMGESAE
ncbi:MAG: TolC family protein [Firmicutes bacterium]|nr:TolC family protein [Bacillota bacterium]